MASEEASKSANPIIGPTRVEGFLMAVEAKTSDPVHRQLLRACRESDPGASMEAELGKIVNDILHEA